MPSCGEEDDGADVDAEDVDLAEESELFVGEAVLQPARTNSRKAAANTALERSTCLTTDIVNPPFPYHIRFCTPTQFICVGVHSLSCFADDMLLHCICPVSVSI